jgi:hypothetical protein
MLCWSIAYEAKNSVDVGIVNDRLPRPHGSKSGLLAGICLEKRPLAAPASRGAKRSDIAESLQLGVKTMIRVVCPGCGNKLNAKDELAGQTRKCPQCATPLKIPEIAATAPTAAPTAAPVAAPPRLERLHRRHRYLILGATQLIAAWENDGHGWMLKTPGGLVSATRNRDQLLPEGDFKLVELKLDTTDQGLRLRGLAVYQLAHRWALANLIKGDDAILTAVTGLGGLKREQKLVVRQVLGEHFMREVWQDSHRVLDYLSSTDFHSHGADE